MQNFNSKDIKHINKLDIEKVKILIQIIKRIKYIKYIFKNISYKININILKRIYI